MNMKQFQQLYDPDLIHKLIPFAKEITADVVKPSPAPTVSIILTSIAGK